MTDKSQKHNYRSSFGATLLFSGVQIYQILVRLIRSKFIALFLGPTGMGITSLLRSTTDLISATTNLGLKTSGVKSVAASFSDGNLFQISKTIKILRRLILITGVLGTLTCALFANVWSELSFNSGNYTIAFVAVSIIILIDQLNNGELALLQGMRQKKVLAKANIFGQTLGLTLTVPLYYYYGVKAIVWVLVLSSLVTFSITRYYTSRIKLEQVNLTWRETLFMGREMIILGGFLGLQVILEQLVTYIVRNFISDRGGLDDVGLYSAGTAIITTYLGLIFSAISTDYFPRLSSTKTKEEFQNAVHIQADLSILLFVPLVLAFIVFIRPIIILLYSESFLPIEHMLYWSVGATLIKAAGWAVSFTLLAKAKPVHFFLNELIASSYSLPLKLVGYQLYGLTGFGIATMCAYILYLIQISIVSNRLFDFSYKKDIWQLLIKWNAIIIGCIVLKFYMTEYWGYLAGGLCLFFSSIAIIKQLNQRLDLMTLLKNKRKRSRN